MIRTRPAVPADVPAVEALVRAAYGRYVERIGRPPAPMTYDYAAVVAGGGAWVAEEAGEVVGLLVLVPAAGHVLLDVIAVRPGAQGRGIGTLLLDLADRQARARGAGEIRLYTNEAMTENLAYYPRRGYVETHRAEQDGYRRVFYTRRLA